MFLTVVPRKGVTLAAGETLSFEVGAFAFSDVDFEMKRPEKYREGSTYLKIGWIIGTIAMVSLF
jgi:hypothetical protein